MRTQHAVAVTVALTLSICFSTKLAVAQAQAPDQPEDIGAVRQMYDGALYPDIQVRTFRHIERLFPTRTVKRGKHVHALPKSDTALQGVEFTSAGKKYDLYDYMSLNRVSGLLILKNGKIAFERYELGNTANSRWMSMSIAKSISSTLVGVAIKDGYIQSLDDPITKYLHTLVGSAYDGVTVRNLLQMASGVKWDETYTNPGSDRGRMLQAQMAGQPGSILQLMSKLPRAGQPGNGLELQHGRNLRGRGTDSCGGQEDGCGVSVGAHLVELRYGIGRDLVAGVGERPGDQWKRVERRLA
jgi:CubicO group peptidase (beta-lactamase class C family)